MEEIMDVTRLADYLKVNPQTIYNWVHADKIPFVKMGDLLRFQKKDIDLWLRKKTTYPNRIFYKEYEIEASPYPVLINDVEKWSLHVDIWENKGYEMTTRPFAGKEYFESKEVAIIHSFNFGKHIIDTKPALLKK
jgi:excisionase family DNA binding protein